MADSIVAKIGIEVDGADQAAAEFQKVGDAAAQSADQLTKSVAPAANETGKALDETTKKAGLSRREMTALGKVMSAFGGGEIAHAAVSIGRVASALGALGAIAIGVGLAAQALAKFGGEAIKAGEAIDKLQGAGGGSFQGLSNMQAGFAKLGISAEKFGETGIGVLAKLAESAEKSADAIAASTKAVDDAQLAYLKAKAAAEPYLAAVYAQDIKNAEAQQKHNQEIAAEAALRKAQANELQPIINKYKQFADGVRGVFDVLTTTETRQTALKAALEGLPLDQIMRKLAQMASSMDAIQKRQFAGDIKAALGLDDKTIALIEKGTAAVDKFLKTPGLSQANVEMLNAVKQALDDSVAMVEGWGQAIVIAFGEAVIKWKRIFAGDLGLGTALAESFAPLTAFLQKAGEAIASFVTTAPANAWQWIVDTATTVWDSVKTLGQQAYDEVVKFVTSAPANAWQWIVDTFNAVIEKIKQALGFGGTPAPQGGGGGGGGGFARGGLLGGRGSGTSDSNLAWVSRGEYIVPAHAVAMPGVLAFLERLRHGAGLFAGGFAGGGLVMPRLSMPAFAGGGAMNHVTIQFPGLPEITGLRASSDVIDQLRRAAAMAQVRSGGRKPSRYS